MHLPSFLLLCLVLGTAAPSAYGRRAPAHTGKHAPSAAPGPAPAGALPSSQATTRIIDGEADANNWADFTAKIIRTDGGVCTGSLVGRAHVLTAAHCLFKADGTLVTCADLVSVEINGVQHSCGTLSAHPDYQQLTGSKDQPQNDIGLIGLATASDVAPIPLASSGPAPGDVLFAVGYGRTEAGEGAPLATTRMFTDMVVYDFADCTKLPSPFSDNFCAGMGTITRDQVVSDGGVACNGDSGGPVVNANDEVTGVVSWGVEHCLAPYSYHARVADHLDYINAMIAAWAA